MQGTFSTRADAHAGVSRLLDRAGAEFRLPRELLVDLRVVLDELIANILQYAYADDAAHDIRLSCEVRDGCLETTLEDDGVAFNPLEAPEPDLNAPLATRRVGGVGLHFMKNLADRVDYERIEGRNRLRILQRISGGPR